VLQAGLVAQAEYLCVFDRVTGWSRLVWDCAPCVLPAGCGGCGCPLTGSKFGDSWLLACVSYLHRCAACEVNQVFCCDFHCLTPPGPCLVAGQVQLCQAGEVCHVRQDAGGVWVCWTIGGENQRAENRHARMECCSRPATVHAQRTCCWDVP
jgi:hypothetical protein